MRAATGLRKAATAWRVGLAGVLLSALALHGCTGAGTDGGTGTEGKDAAPVNIVVIKTNKGQIEIELFPDKAPATVENFLAYADARFYDGTIFHRVIENFMIQGGGYDADKQRRPTRDPIKNEADNGMKNDTGTIAMARTNAPDSATSQFFINVKQNTFLDYTSPETPQSWGYTVFGRVIDGIDVVRVIEQTPTRDEGGAFKDFPEEPILIESIRRK